MSDRVMIGDKEFSPEDIAATFEPIPDKPPPPKRVGAELLAKLVEGSNGDGPAIEVQQIEEGCRIVLFYRGERQVSPAAAATIQDQWFKWYDGRTAAPLVLDARVFRFVQVPRDAEFYPLVAFAKERDAALDVGDCGADPEFIDCGYATQAVAELRAFLRRGLPADLSSRFADHEVRDNPVAIAIGLVRAGVAAMEALDEDGEAPEREEAEIAPARSPRWFRWLGVGVFATGIIGALGLLAGWW